MSSQLFLGMAVHCSLVPIQVKAALFYCLYFSGQALDPAALNAIHEPNVVSELGKIMTIF